MRPVRGMRLAALVAVGGLTLPAAACGAKPAETDGSSASASPSSKMYQVCMVTDQGGLADKSFNTSAWAGLEDAKAEDPDIAIVNVESGTEADYEPNLAEFARQKCDLILAIGGVMGTALEKVAKANPDRQFAIVDYASEVSNVHSIQFDTAQAGYLAGYLAAGMSKTGKVATYGGLKVAPVTITMDGFAGGVAYYNEVKHKKVEVLGWDVAKQTGTFADTFADPAKGKKISDAFVAQGADVVLPVARETGTGTAAAATASNGGYSVIWMDQDGCVSDEVNCAAFLTTVVKNVRGAVLDAATMGATGDLKTAYLGTLANEGVSLAPFHVYDGKIPVELKDEIDKLEQDIVDGVVKVSSPALPQ